jgi:hypothetical protein
MSHAPAIDLGHDQPPLPNQHFSSWLRGQTTLFISQIVAVLGIVLFIAEEVYYVSHFGEHSKLLNPLTIKLIVDYAHIIFIAVFILVLIRVLDDNERGSYRVKRVYERVFKEPKKDEENVGKVLETSKEQLRTFKLRFLWFWIGMLCLYISFACQHTYEASFEPVQEPASKKVSVLFDGKGRRKEEEEFKGELHLRIIDEEHGAAPENNASAAEEPGWEKFRVKLVFASFAFFFNNFTLLFVFSCFLVMYIKPGERKKKEWKYWVGSSVAVAFLTLLFLCFLVLKWGGLEPKSAGEYVAIFDALSGVINAVVLALLVARLDSKLVGLPSWLISILYSYAAVQPLFLVFELSDSELLKTIATLVLVFVFISKIYFFLIIFYALQTGKMLNYLTCFPILRRRAEEHRRPAASHASVFAHLMKFAPSVPRKLAKWYSRARRERVNAPERLRRAYRGLTHALARLRRAHPQEVRERLGLAVSELLRRYSLWVSEVIGWAAILYFFGSLIFGSLIVSHVLPETQDCCAGFWNNTVFVASKILRPPPAAAFALKVAQLVFVALIIVTLHLISKGNDVGRKAAADTARSIFNEPSEHGDSMRDGEAQLKKFKRYFLYFWYVTFLLYAVFLFDPQVVDSPRPERTFGHMLELLLFPALEFLFASLNLMCAFWCFVVLHSPAFVKPSGVMLQDSEMMRKHFEAKHERFEARQKLLVNNATFGVLLLITVYVLLLGWLSGITLSGGSLRDYATVFDGVTGLLSAVVLALLIARMDSKLFSLPSRLIWMLFTYASIQSLFIAFAQNDPVLQMVRTSVLTAALGLKICFFLIVAYSLQSGRMLNYLVCFPLLKERVDSIFENQFEIRLAHTEDHEFTFSILKKNRLYYSAAGTFKSREKCDTAVEELSELMKQSKPYGAPRHSLGTYWVEVRSDDKLICESVPLRSAEEALDLIDESIGKVPYCKYTRL